MRALILIAALTACGGGGGAPNPVAKPLAPEVVMSEPYTIVRFADTGRKAGDYLAVVIDLCTRRIVGWHRHQHYRRHRADRRSDHQQRDHCRGHDLLAAARCVELPRWL